MGIKEMRIPVKKSNTTNALLNKTVYMIRTIEVCVPINDSIIACDSKFAYFT